MYTLITYFHQCFLTFTAVVRYTKHTMIEYKVSRSIDPTSSSLDDIPHLYLPMPHLNNVASRQPRQGIYILRMPVYTCTDIIYTAVVYIQSPMLIKGIIREYSVCKHRLNPTSLTDVPNFVCEYSQRQQWYIP